MRASSQMKRVSGHRTALAVLMAALFGPGCSRVPSQGVAPSGEGTRSAEVSTTSSAAGRTASVETSAPTKDPNFSPAWAKKLRDGFLYFNDALIKNGQAPLEATVVPATHGARFYSTANKNVTFWTPTVGDLSKLNAARDLVEQKEPRIAKRIIEYRYQVVGINDGNKRVFVNAFCGLHQPSQRSAKCPDAFARDEATGDWVDWPPGACPTQDWLYEPVRVKDGGACYFNFKYEPNTGAISELSVNGEA